MGSNTLSAEFVFVEGKNKRECVLFSGQRETRQRISEAKSVLRPRDGSPLAWPFSGKLFHFTDLDFHMWKVGWRVK